MGERQIISIFVRYNCNNDSGLHKGCMIITECYKGFTGVKKVGIFIITFSSWDQERKIPRFTKAAVFQRRCFEAILLCLWLTCVCDG